MPGEQDFEPPFLPDLSRGNWKQPTLFSKKPLPKWRTIAPGLNLEGQCKRKSCPAFNRMVWTNLGYGIFNMEEMIYKCQCPMSSQGKPHMTKGNKRIGFYLFKVDVQGLKCDQQKKEGAFQPYKHFQQNGFKDGFIKFDGINGPFVQWNYMKITIDKFVK